MITASFFRKNLRGAVSVLALLGLVVAALLIVSKPPVKSSPAAERTLSAPLSESPMPTAGATEAYCQRHAEVICVGDDDGARGLIIEPRVPAAGMVLWDPGGPGIPLPDNQLLWPQVIPRAIQRYRVLLPLEPWVGEQPSSECLTGAATRNVPSACRLRRLATDSGDVVQLVKDAMRTAETPLVGAYLQSFGGPRMQGLLWPTNKLGVRWVVLESPAPQAGAAAKSIVNYRRAAAMDVLSAGCKAGQCQRRVDVASRLARRGVPGAATGREVALGILAAATRPQSNELVLSKLRRQLDSGSLSSDLAGKLKRASRVYEQSELDQVRPSLIGFWADICPAYRGWRQLRRSTDPFVTAQAWVFRGCSDSQAEDTTSHGSGSPSLLRGEASGDVSPVASKPRTLVVTGTLDTVADPVLQRAWAEAIPEADHLSVDDGHQFESGVFRQVEAWLQAD